MESNKCNGLEGDWGILLTAKVDDAYVDHTRKNVHVQHDIFSSQGSKIFENFELFSETIAIYI